MEIINHHLKATIIVADLCIASRRRFLKFCQLLVNGHIKTNTMLSHSFQQKSRKSLIMHYLI